MTAFSKLSIEGPEGEFELLLHRSTDQFPAVIFAAGAELEDAQVDPWLRALATGRRTVLAYSLAGSQPRLLDRDPGERERASGLDRAVSELSACREFLTRELTGDTGVAVIGLGAGGTCAYLLACRRSDISAAVMLSGRVDLQGGDPRRTLQPFREASHLGCPLLCIYNQGDALASESDLERFQVELERAGRHVELVRPVSRHPVPQADNANVEWVLSFLSEFGSAG